MHYIGEIMHFVETQKLAPSSSFSGGPTELWNLPWLNFLNFKN